MGCETYVPKMMQHSASKIHLSGKCPICGGLQCLCRPRFFAGQLLTEEDLNRLDHYIVEKNRLHNRYLHGWGVVCGLEVLCHHCKGQVVVKPGYAIGPCGEDIIVCKDDVVDVCALINKCREKERCKVDCENPYLKRGEDDSCKEAEETWILAIRYDEKPSRGITALRGSSESSCHSRRSDGDDCSSAYSSGCSQENSPKAKASCCESPKKTFPQCEPTIICEGYRYEVFRAPVEVGTERSDGVMVERIMTCVKTLIDAWRFPFSAPDVPPSKLQELCCRIKTDLQDFIADHPTTYCQLSGYLEKVVCPERMTAKQFAENMAILLRIGVAYLLNCLCSSLLPPCSEPVNDPRVVLAGVVVSKEGGRILRICNWTTLRKFVTTFPSLQYWLSPLPFMRNLREGLEEICCLEPLKRRLAEEEPGAAGIGFFDRMVMAKVGSNIRAEAFGELLMDALSGKATPIKPETLIKGLKGLKDQNGKPYLKDIERENVPQFLLLNQLIQPLLKSFVPEGFDDMLKVLGTAFKEEGKPLEEADEIGKLRAELSKLRETVKKQEETLKDLLKKNPK